MVDVLDFYLFVSSEEASVAYSHLLKYLGTWRGSLTLHYLHPDNGSDFLVFVRRTQKGEMVVMTYWL